MKNLGYGRFPDAAQLFKFCQTIFIEQTGVRVNDQTIGLLLDFNPSDCSHWKRGEKNIVSIFALEKLSKKLKVEESIIHDLANGMIDSESGIYEHGIVESIKSLEQALGDIDPILLADRRNSIVSFVQNIYKKIDIRTCPVYVPEIVSFFTFIQLVPMEIMDIFSRLAEKEEDSYVIKFRSGILTPHIRVSIINNLADIILGDERKLYPELGSAVQDEDLRQYEKFLFISEMLVPQVLLKSEIKKVDMYKNMIAELAALFWVPKIFINFQMRNIAQGFLNNTENKKRNIRSSNIKKSHLHLAST